MKKIKFTAAVTVLALMISCISCSSPSSSKNPDNPSWGGTPYYHGNGDDNYDWPDFPSGAYTELPVNTPGSAGPSDNTTITYVTFGLWPQTKKADDIAIIKNGMVDRYRDLNGMTVYVGTDNNYYVEYDIGYYKVEPVKWRIITNDYDHDDNPSTAGKKLLLAESILMGLAYYNLSEYRTASNGSTIYTNNYEYSQVRAFLNGLSYPEKMNEQAVQTTCNNFKDKGFLQNAFSQTEQACIATTTVVNDAESTYPDEYTTPPWGDGDNDYASDTPTSDKIFLLSEQEVTKSAYGFAAYNVETSSRIRVPTDFAIAHDAYSAPAADNAGYWLLRSPYYHDGFVNRCGDQVLWVLQDGSTGHNDTDCNTTGVVPALCLK